MKLLFCCENYFPSRGGVQEVMRQVAERLVAAGHDVTVATRTHPDRTGCVLNGVRIKEFDIRGSLIAGIVGDLEGYREFVARFDGDAIMIKAAQQWSFDALWPLLDQIKMRKVFIPCGFSGLYEPAFADYFAKMPEVLRKFDHLIFYAERYRDIDFARAHGVTAFSIVANGASEREFDRPADGSLRRELGIPADDFLVLTVGSPVDGKGHRKIAEAVASMDTGGRNVTAILDGAWPKPALGSLWNPRIVLAVARMLARDGRQRVFEYLGLEPRDERLKGRGGAKRILRIDLPREKVVSAFLESDLFVFASMVEYSPLVLFEAAAAGLPFVSGPVGNAEEIVRWTGGGWICDAEVDEKGYVTLPTAVLAREIAKAIRSPELLNGIGAAGKTAWRERFNWQTIAASYERVLMGAGSAVTAAGRTEGEVSQGAP
ncbi:MAG: glycosyltransferase family 4 protein [Xanthobacteraceae bacterium]|nr:glycosyltransferase family 4 protein [Xanthobacteraceae bacterium]